MVKEVNNGLEPTTRLAFPAFFCDNHDIDMRILGVEVSPVTHDEALRRLNLFLDEPGRHFVTTPNPEIILYARKRPDYSDTLNKADLALPDGAGLLFASRIIGGNLKERVSGSDMIPEILGLAREKKLRVALLGGLDQPTADKAAEVIRGWGNEVVYVSHGVPKAEWENKPFHDKMLDELRASRPQVVLVGFGHPKQEQWIDAYAHLLPEARLLIGCGGSLDFIAGARKRAPRWVRKANLEWLWRIVREPRRIGRIMNAVIIFPAVVIYEHLRKR